MDASTAIDLVRPRCWARCDVGDENNRADGNGVELFALSSKLV